MQLSKTNCSVDKSSGAVLIQRSPELLEILELKKEIKSLHEKLDRVLEKLEVESDG